MNRISIPFALALLGSTSLAQSRPVHVLESGQAAKVSVLQAEPAGQKKGDVAVWLGLDLRRRTDGPERLEVVEVVPGSPAERAGAQAGDKLVALAGRPVSDHAALVDVLRGRKVGEQTLLTVERSRTIELGANPDSAETGFLGVTGEAEGQTVQSSGEGVRIGSLTPGQPAAAAGLVSGERICAVDGQEVGSFAELQKKVQSHKPGEKIELRTQRDLRVELAARPGLADDGRSVRGMGGSAFPEKTAPELPRRGANKGLFEPDGGMGGGRSDLALPKTAKPGAPKQAPALPKQALPGPTDDFGRKLRTPASPDQVMTSQLLDEIRALRKEVAELRRQIDALRQQESKKPQ